MKQIILVLFLFTMNNCNSQNKKELIVNKQAKKDTMQHFNINEYKDWEIDDSYSVSTSDKYLKKDSQRIKILDFNDKIKIEKSTIYNPYIYIYLYNKAKGFIILTGKTFYSIETGIWKYYDSNGKIIKETDYDKPFKFSIEDIIKKMKQDLNIDLMNVSKRIDVSRSEHPKPLYTITVPQNPSRILRWIKVDGTTGEIISNEIKTPPNKHSPDWQPSKSKK